MQKIIWFCSISLFLCPVASNAQSIIETEEIYRFEMMEADLSTLKANFPIELVSIGKSEKGRNLWAAKLGKGEKSLLFVGAHHGREWMTTSLLMKMLEQYATAYQHGSKIGSYSSQLLDEVSIWFVPMVNPDGVSIQQGNLSRLSLREKMAVWQMNGYRFHWTRWKANAQGIDLNRQYPAGWDEVKTDQAKPYYQFYKGEEPLQAAEVQAFVSFTKQVQPLLAVSYHTSGREIFWHYHNKQEHVIRDYQFAKKTVELTKYKLSMPKDHAVGSGFTDWFITEFARPAMTIELSYLVDETAPPLSVFPEEWARNQFVGMMLVDEVQKME